MTAHPHVDSNTGHLVSFSYQVGPQLFPPSLKTALTFWEFTPGKAAACAEVEPLSSRAASSLPTVFCRV